MGGEGPVWTTKYMLQHISDVLHNSPGDEICYSTFLIFCTTRRETKFATVVFLPNSPGDEMCYSTFLNFLAQLAGRRNVLQHIFDFCTTRRVKKK